MSIPERIIREWEESQGVDRLGPIVRFYDGAVPANQSAREWQTRGKWKDERPRFKSAVFIEKKTRNDPTGSTFCQEANEDHFEQYPREWAEYCKAREQVEHRAPPLAAIPTMNPAAFEELRALGLTDCRKVAQYEGELDGIEEMREAARRIMEAIDEDNHVRERRDMGGEREPLQESLERPLYSIPTRVNGTGRTGPRKNRRNASQQPRRGRGAGARRQRAGSVRFTSNIQV